MSYKEMCMLSLFVNNRQIHPLMDKVAKKWGYDDYYKDGIVRQYYSNPIGFMYSHNCGEDLFNLVMEEAKKLYGDRYENE